MSKLSDQITKRIEKQNIEKLPKWVFVTKRSFIWGSLVVAVLLGAVAFSMIIFQFGMVEWDVHPMVGRGKGSTFFYVFPYFWVIVAALLFTFVYFDFQKTRKGHRYDGALVVGLSIVLSLFIGLSLHLSNVSERLETVMQKAPMYKQLQYDREGPWRAPEDGLVAGTILEVKDGKILLLEDLGKRIWFVEFAEAKVGREVSVIKGEKLKVLGEMYPEDRFVADELRAWKMGGGMKR